jgi:hypothetical protein
MLKMPDIAVFSWAKQIGLTFALQHASHRHAVRIYGGFHAAKLAK